MSFSGRNVLVTGGTQGIGHTIAALLARAGAQVVITGRDPQKGHAAAAEIGGACSFHPCDIADAGSVQALFDHLDRRGPLHHAVNNAGITAPRAPIRDIDPDSWQHVLDINLTGTLRCLHHQLRRLDMRPGGSIVNVSSCAGVQVIADQAAYSVSKAAVNSLTRVAAIEAATAQPGRHPVRVNAIAPGPTLGGMNTPERLAANPEATRRKLAVTAMKRMAAPEEIAQAATFLLSDAASYITGAVLDADGGYSAGKF